VDIRDVWTTRTSMTSRAVDQEASTLVLCVACMSPAAQHVATQARQLFMRLVLDVVFSPLIVVRAAGRCACWR
jgi:hypothetical protein